VKCWKELLVFLHLEDDAAEEMRVLTVHDAISSTAAACLALLFSVEAKQGWSEFILG